MPADPAIPTRASRGGHAFPPDPCLQVIRDRLRGRTDVTLALVFGSRARGTARPDSDVDVAVRGTGLDLLGLAAELSRVTGHEVDVVHLDEAGIPLLARIAREGLVVHEGAPGAAARWRSHTLVDLEIDGPWYARMREAWLARVAGRGL